ncbi:MAG TPA: ATP-binding cassette domain-containing protein [Chitinophagaceae bacterium]|jgi:ABC-type multidrug transport system ATPase subunit
MNHSLEADGIQLEFDGRPILSDIYLKCETAKITGLLGRNGQGKTSLMNVIYGTLEAGSKSVRFDRQPVFHAYKRPELLLLLTQFNFIPSRLSLKRIFSDFSLDYRTFEKTFPEFRAKYNASIKTLSGGERRLVEIYVIVKSESCFALLDEPFSHLSPLQVEQVKEMLKEEKQHKGLLITDHLYEHVIDISDTLYVLANGKTHLIKDISEIETLGYARLS